MMWKFKNGKNGETRVSSYSTLVGRVQMYSGYLPTRRSWVRELETQTLNHPSTPVYVARPISCRTTGDSGLFTNGREPKSVLFANTEYRAW